MTRLDVEHFIKHLPEGDFDSNFGKFLLKVSLIALAIMAGIAVILRILWGLF